MTDHSDRNLSDESVSRLISALSPDPADQPDARRALDRFKSRIEQERRNELTMFGLKIPKKAQRPLAAGLVIALLVGLLAIPQVRATASGFLSIFRVQRFVLINVSQERMAQIQKAIGDQSAFGQREVVKDSGGPQQVGSLDEAAAQAGFTPLNPDASYGDPTKVEVSGESVTRYRPDVAALREVLGNLNLDPELIPANIDGKPFDITVPAAIGAAYGKPGKGFMFVQMLSPTVKVPDGVDVEKLGEAMLQVLGMTPDEAARMSKSIDWATTLVVPVPSNLNDVREISVRGTTGLLYGGESGPQAKQEQGGAERYSVTVVWQANGYLYVVQGYNETQALAFAESLK